MGTALDRFFGGSVLSPRTMLDDFFSMPLMSWAEPRVIRELVPQATVDRADDAVTLKIGLPGFAPEDVDVFVENDMLTIHAERHKTSSGNGNGAVWDTNYRRSVTLPDNVDQEGIEANLENGLLAVRIPYLTDEQKEARRLKIEVKRSTPEVEAGRSSGAEQKEESKTS